MMKNALKFISKEISGLHQAAYLLGFFALLSQVLALVRDRLLAGAFGAGSSLDIYYASFRIPDFIFISVGSMVSVSVLIPFLIEKMKSGPDEGRRFISNVFSFFFLLIILASAVVYFFVPQLTRVLFPGFSAPDLEKTISLTKILLLSPIFLGLSNLFGTLTQAYRRFFLYALSPILYNFGIIAGVLFFYPIFDLEGLAYGVILGAIMHFLIQVPFVISHNMFPYIRLSFDFSEIKKVFAVSLPRTFTLGSDNISVLFLLSIATLMTTGSIAIFTLSYNLQSVPLSIIGVSYSLAVFPLLVRLISDGQREKFISQIIISAQHIIFWSIPVAVLFVVLRAQIVRTIYGSGNFNWNDTRLTAAALAIFASSIVFQNLTLLFVRAYYAVGNTRTPFIAKMINVITTVILGYGFMIWFQNSPAFQNFLETILRVQGLPGTIVLTLPLGWAVGELFNTLVLWFIFQKDFKGVSKPVTRTFFQTLFASLIMGYVSYLSLNIFDKVFDLKTTFGIFMQGLLSGLVGIVVAICVLVIIRNREIQEIWLAFKEKVWRKPVISPGPSVTG